MHDMELDWIEDFIALTETGNFTRAAQMRHTTQPAYSRRIQRLEDWVGVPLFNRDARPVRLTTAGEALQQTMPRLRDELLDTRRQACAAASGLQNATKIYTTNTLAIGLLPEWIRTEGIDPFSLVVASSTACIRAVQDGRAMLAVIPDMGDTLPATGMGKEVIARDRLAFCAREIIADLVWLEHGQLYGPIMTYAPGTHYGAQISRLLGAEKLRIANDPVCESASAEALLAQTRLGLGAGWIPQSLISKEDRLLPLLNHKLDLDYDVICLQNPANE